MLAGATICRISLRIVAAKFTNHRIYRYAIDPIMEALEVDRDSVEDLANKWWIEKNSTKWIKMLSNSFAWNITTADLKIKIFGVIFRNTYIYYVWHDFFMLCMCVGSGLVYKRRKNYSHLLFRSTFNLFFVSSVPNPLRKYINVNYTMHAESIKSTKNYTRHTHKNAGNLNDSISQFPIYVLGFHVKRYS